MMQHEAKRKTKEKPKWELWFDEDREIGEVVFVKVRGGSGGIFKYYIECIIQQAEKRCLCSGCYLKPERKYTPGITCSVVKCFEDERSDNKSIIIKPLSMEKLTYEQVEKKLRKA